jgi:signal transduction histidine kinase
MINFLKQFAVSATSSKRNLFFAARIRLTAYYIAIMAVILIVFSLVLYAVLSRQLHDNFEGRFTSNETQEEVFLKTTDGVQTTLVIADLVVLLLTAAGSYVLAGKTLQPIREALDAQKRFTADASHELRTPLAIMKTESEVTLKNSQASSVELRESISSNLEEVERMSAMVESLLALSSVDHHGEIALQNPVSLFQVTEHVVAKLRPMAEQKHIRVATERSDEGLVLGNLEALSRMIYNLLQNAIKYTPSKGNITLSVISKDSVLTLIIADTGVGISSESNPHIFKRFYKADSARTNTIGGVGLGLSIVKSIVDQHQGNINIESQPNEGTTVEVTFKKYSV